MQQSADFSKKVTCALKKLEASVGITYLHRANDVESGVTQSEREQLMIVCGSLMWIARSCRPGVSDNMSKFRGTIRKATEEDIWLAKRTAMRPRITSGRPRGTCELL